MNAEWQPKIIKAIIKHFYTAIKAGGYDAYVEGQTPDPAKKGTYVEIRYTKVSWKMKDNRDWEGRIIVNILCVTPSGLALKAANNVYEIEELLGFVSSLFSVINISELGCLILESNFGEDIQVQAPRQVEADTDVKKATVTGHYVICLTNGDQN
jgi:hypothetical protein